MFFHLADLGTVCASLQRVSGLKAIKKVEPLPRREQPFCFLHIVYWQKEESSGLPQLGKIFTAS